MQKPVPSLLDMQYMKNPSICFAWHAPCPGMRLKSSAEANAKFFLLMTRLGLFGTRGVMGNILLSLILHSSLNMRRAFCCCIWLVIVTLRVQNYSYEAVFVLQSSAA